MKHVTVYEEPCVYAGWPANHGAWQWGDEFLVGFIRGEHTPRGMHNVKGKLEKVLARSLDGGETWTVERPNMDFEARKVFKAAPALDFRNSIIRVCGGYDHGGEACVREGGFYLSENRGKTWHGAYPFDIGLPEGKHNTSRTCTLGNLIFLSAADVNHWGSDFTFCARVEDGVLVPHSVVLNDDSRAVMPAAAKVKDRIIVALRRRGTCRPGGWIASVYSDDGGITWGAPVHVAETGKDNGNPPALVELDGNLYCAYGNRSRHTIEVMKSLDAGSTWVAHAELRRGEAPDIGYPRLFRRNDGQLVCVYYWTEEFELPQRIEATHFEG